MIVRLFRAGAALAAITAIAAAEPEPAPPLAPAALPADPAPTLRVRIIPATPAVPTAATPQPLICRSTLITGSLIAKHKQCLTTAQWRYVDDAHEAEARRLMLDNMNKPNCDAKC